MFIISARLSHTTPDGWEGSRELPTFGIGFPVQGVLSEASAVKLARSVILPFPEKMPEVTAHITAVRGFLPDVVQQWAGPIGERTIRVTVPVEVEISEADYLANYGSASDIVDYASQNVRASAGEHLARLGWAKVTNTER